MTTFREYEKMDAKQLEQQQIILREKMKEGKTTFGDKAFTVFKAVLAGLGAGLLGALGTGLVTDNDKAIKIVGGVVGLGAAIPVGIMMQRGASDRSSRRFNTDLTHVERLLLERKATAIAKQSGEREV